MRARLLLAAVMLAAVACHRTSQEAPGAAAGTSDGAGSKSIPAFLPPGATGKLASRAMETFVYETASSSSKKLGYLRAGAIVGLRGGTAGNKDCPGGWYPIEPRGFVCVGPTATLDLDDEIVRASARRPELTAGLPYGYAVVRNQGAPFYSRMPTLDEEKKLEPDWDYHFRTLEGAEREESEEGGYPQLSSISGGPYPIEPSPGVLPGWATDNRDDALPSFLNGGGFVPNLSGLAVVGRPEFEGSTTCEGCIPVDAARPRKRLGVSFVSTFRDADRRWLLTTDLLLMPADRVRLVRGTSFHGVELGEGKLQLPIVFVSKQGAKRYAFEGKKMVAQEELPWRQAFEVTAKQRIVAGVHYHELKDGSYVAAPDAVRLDPIKKMPKWGKEGERWIEVNIAKQTLLAVDGTQPVYATLVSTGSGGLESPKVNPYVTPRGIFRVNVKHAAATMDSNQPEAEFELRDVPYIQYFKDGYALHAAYWHDQFGQPRSHGCINLPPIDAKWLFGFTKPELPTGWHGVMQALTGTVVWIHA